MKTLLSLFFTLCATAVTVHADLSLENLERFSRGLSNSLAANRQKVHSGTLPFEITNDSVFQKDLAAAFEEVAPEEWRAAAKSAGNMHNPKMFPLRKYLSAAFLKTRFAEILNRDLAAHGMQVTSISAEKFSYPTMDGQRTIRGIFYLDIGPADGKQGPAAAEKPVPPTLTFAKKLTVPRALFKATPLEEAVDFLRSMSRTGMEVEGAPAPFKLDFVVMDADKQAKPVSLDLKSIPLDELCEKVATAAGMSVRFDAEAVVFHTRDPAPQPGK